MIPAGVFKPQMRPAVRYISFSRVSANLPMASLNTDIDSSINTMDRILSILQDAQANNTSSIINTKITSPLKPRSEEELGHDLFNYKTVDSLLQLHTQKSVDVFQNSNPGRVKDVLESYIHIFKARFVGQRLQPLSRGSSVYTSSESPENAKAILFSSIAEQYDEQPERIFSIIGSFIRKEARDALQAIPATETSWGNFDFGKIKLYQPFRGGTRDPFVLRLGLSTKHFPTNALAAMINDPGVLEKFIKNAQFSSSLNTKSLQTFMVAQSVAGGLIFKILFQKHVSNTDREISDFVEAVGLEKLKAIIASRSMLLNRLDWYLPYRYSFQELDDSVLENEDSIVTAMADLFDRFFGVCYKRDSKYCDRWVQTLINFCVTNYSKSQFFDGLLKDSISAFKEKAVGSSFDAMSANWKEYGFLERSEGGMKRRKKTRGRSLGHEITAAEFQTARELISSAREDT